jgi:glycosyltransferase involved in cell wall biosynthesis
MSLRFHIDQPETWTLSSKLVMIRGWCFEIGGLPIGAIRLKTGTCTIAGTINLPRPDVKAALPEAPGIHTGFEILGALPPGRHLSQVEAQLSDGTWALCASITISVPRKIRPFWLGGGTWSELMYDQVPTHAVHAARKLRVEQFPAFKSKDRPRLKISVVTPSFNQVAFLAQTMGSVLGQTGCDPEYVVQDGGSTDGSTQLIRRESSRLSTWSSERDSGQADAIAKGFAKTAGAPEDLMAWINSDDFYLPGALAFVASYFARHPEVDVLYGHRIVVDESSREIARWFLPPHHHEVLRLYDFVPQETLFWRRRIWDQVGGLDSSFQFAMDWDLLLRFQTAGAKIVRVPYFLACFRVHGAQKTTARMRDLGQKEIDLLRKRTFGRTLEPQDLEQNPRLLRYLRRSAFIGFLWKMGVRAP